MKRLTNKEWKRLVTTKIDDVNYVIDELDDEYIEISCGGEVTRMPYNEENRLWVIRMIEGQDRTAQDLSFSLATLEFKSINYACFIGFAIIGVSVSICRNNEPIRQAMYAIGGWVPTMVPAVLKTLTESKIEKIKMLSFPGVKEFKSFGQV